MSSTGLTIFTPTRMPVVLQYRMFVPDFRFTYKQKDMHTVKKHTNIMLSLRTQAESDAYCVGVPFSVVSDFNPLLVISLGHFLALFVLDLNTKHTQKNMFSEQPVVYIELLNRMSFGQNLRTEDILNI